MNSIKKTILILTAIAIVQGGCNINVPEEIVPNAFTKQQKAVAPTLLYPAIATDIYQMRLMIIVLMMLGAGQLSIKNSKSKMIN